MKKVIIGILAISAFSFSYEAPNIAVTGMLVDSGSGIYLNARIMNIDSDINEFYDPGYAISFEHKMDTGLEFALSYMIESGYGFDYNPMGLQVNYHLNDDTIIGLNLNDFTDDLDDGNDTKSIHATYHTETNSYITLNYNLDYDEDELTLQFGKLWKMDSIILGASYAANSSDLDMGFILLKIGTTF